MHTRAGFTLAEIAMVLVTIALTIGGVLIGQELVKAAAIRSTVSQMTKYQAAVNTFTTKYGGLSGDLANADSVGTGFTSRSSHSPNVTNGNSLLESEGGSTAVAGNETLLFWRDLADAGLIEGNFFSTDGQPPAQMEGVPGPFPVTYFPVSEINDSNFITVYSANSTNYYQMTSITSIFTGTYVLSYMITPLQAVNLDTKLDDGLPITGTIRGARSTTTLGVACIPSAAGGTGDACCGDNTGSSVNMYKTVTYTLANTPACQLTIQFD